MTKSVKAASAERNQTAVVSDAEPRGELGTTRQPRRRIPAAEFALPAMLVGLVALFSVLQPDIFPTVANLRGIVLTQSVLAVLALAALFPLIVGDFDLSIAGNLGLAGVLVTGLPSMSGLDLLPAMVIALAACTAVGLVNGALVHLLHLNAFIATLATGLILGGLTDWYTGSEIIYENIPAALPQFGKDRLLGVPYPVLLVIVVAVMAWYLLEHTPVGRYFYAVGGSRETARLSGLRVSLLGIAAFMISGFLAGLAGILEAAVVGTGNPSVGGSFLLPAFAAVFLGATTIRIGRFNPFGTLIAVVTIAVGVAGLQLLGIPFYIEPIFNGAVLIAAVLAIRFLRGTAR